MSKDKKAKQADREPVVENRKSRYDYTITETLECGLKLVGTEVKSLRLGQASLAEGWVRAELEPRFTRTLNFCRVLADYSARGGVPSPEVVAHLVQQGM